MKEITIPAAPILLGNTGAGNILITVPRVLRESIFNMVDKAGWDYKFRIHIASQWTPRTTGWKSQNHHINGHIQQICQDTGNGFTAVKERMKYLAIDRGYPIETMIDHTIQPKSEAEISTTEAGYLVDAIHQFAAEWAITLVEE